MKDVSDHAHAELKPEEMLNVLKETYTDVEKTFDIAECHFKQEHGILATVTIEQNGKKFVVEAHGNGRLNAVNNAIQKHFNLEYTLDEYEEHSLSRRSSAKAMTYVAISRDDNKMYWGIGTDEDIITSSIMALVHAVNRMINA